VREFLNPSGLCPLDATCGSLSGRSWLWGIAFAWSAWVTADANWDAGQCVSLIPPPHSWLGHLASGTISAREVDHGQGHDDWKAAGQRGATAARTNRRDVRRGADGGDPCRVGCQPVPWRRPSQGLGTVTTLRHPELVAAGASIDARE